jgi:dienelactone hydrolase
MTQTPEAVFEIAHDDVMLRGWAVSPTGPGRRPAVLMFPGGTGPTPAFTAAVRELAGLGYLTIGVDMYGGDADISTPEACGVHFEALLRAPDRLRARALAWVDAVAAREDVDANRMSAIGYCFGGKCVLELVRGSATLRSVTSFHGLLKTHAPASHKCFDGHVAVWTGGRDPYAPVEDLAGLCAEFDQAQIDYQTTLFAQALHSFTDPGNDGIRPGIAYNAVAHRVAWAGTLAMLDLVLR